MPSRPEVIQNSNTLSTCVEQQNESMELNYLAFTNGGYKYVVYQMEKGNEQSVGIKVINIQTKKVTDIKGDPSTLKGSLAGFRNDDLLSGLVEASDDLY
jgi:hypothetical protein